MTAHAAERNQIPAVACCGVAIGCLAVVAARQLGLIQHLADPPGAIWASDRITTSKTAHPLGVPDGLLGLASYTATLALLTTATGSSTASRLVRWKLAADAGAAGFNAVRQVVTFGKLCSWCTGAAAATAAMVWLGLRAAQE